jgi:hypothetical protein
LKEWSDISSSKNDKSETFDFGGGASGEFTTADSAKNFADVLKSEQHEANQENTSFV